MVSLYAGKYLKKMKLNKSQGFVYFALGVGVVFLVLYLLSKWSNKEGFSGEAQMVLFYADWCGHCNNFKPEWNKLKQTNDVPGVSFNDEDCTNGLTPLAKQHNVKGFPTLVFINGGNAQQYNGERSEAAVKSFIKSNQ